MTRQGKSFQADLSLQRQINKTYRDGDDDMDEEEEEERTIAEDQVGTPEQAPPKRKGPARLARLDLTDARGCEAAVRTICDMVYRGKIASNRADSAVRSIKELGLLQVQVSLLERVETIERRLEALQVPADPEVEMTDEELDERRDVMRELESWEQEFPEEATAIHAFLEEYAVDESAIRKLERTHSGDRAPTKSAYSQGRPLSEDESGEEALAASSVGA